jgi:hypothetical protein
MSDTGLPSGLSTGLPTGLWLEAHLRRLDQQFKPYYIINRGNHGSGTVLLKINGLGAGFKLLQQERNLDGVLVWVNALNTEMIEETKADDYIRRAITRDPDVWAIEIEDSSLINPFL